MKPGSDEMKKKKAAQNTRQDETRRNLTRDSRLALSFKRLANPKACITKSVSGPDDRASGRHELRLLTGQEGK